MRKGKKCRTELPQAKTAPPAALEQFVADTEAAHEQDQTTIAALRQRIVALEDELRRVGQQGSLAEFLAQVRAGGMRVVVKSR